MPEHQLNNFTGICDKNGRFNNFSDLQIIVDRIEPLQTLWYKQPQVLNNHLADIKPAEICLLAVKLHIID